MRLSKTSITLEKITGTMSQVEALYEILKKRKHAISHRDLPSLKEHKKFVKENQYRVWYLIRFNSNYVGTVYLTKSNCIGISLPSNIEIFSSVIQLIKNKHNPLKEVKSLRTRYFHINVAPRNTQVKKQLQRLKAKKIQITFSI